MYPYARRCECGTVGEQRSVSEFHCPACTKRAEIVQELPPGASLPRGHVLSKARSRARSDRKALRKGHGPQ